MKINMENAKYCVIIPVYNEAMRIGKTISQLHKILISHNLEVIFIDNASYDETVNIIRKAKFRVSKLDKILGKGAAIKNGLKIAASERIIICDCDLVYLIPFILSKDDSSYDIIVFSRWKLGSNVIGMPFSRHISSNIVRFLNRYFANLYIKDTQCGVKIIKNTIAKFISENVENNEFFFDIESLFISLKNGFKIKEIPIEWHYSGNSKISIFKDGFQFILDFTKYLLNNI